jgi:hypothetical protein
MDILSSVADPLIAGLIVALTIYLTALTKGRAEVAKIEAETDKIRAEVAQILACRRDRQGDEKRFNPLGMVRLWSHPEFYDIALDVDVAYREAGTHNCCVARRRTTP